MKNRNIDVSFTGLKDITCTLHCSHASYYILYVYKNHKKTSFFNYFFNSQTLPMPKIVTTSLLAYISANYELNP